MDSKYSINKSILVPELSTNPLLIESIKEGGFGRVLIVGSQSGDKYALKILKTELGLNYHEILKEAEKLTYLQDHPNIAEIIGIYSLDLKPSIVMRYYPETLANKMEDKLETRQIIEFTKQISLGLRYLHEKANTIHLDLKPQNILINNKGVVAISDFGISVAFPKPEKEGLTKDLFMSGIVGTVTYMSPEQFTTQKVSTKTDIFSMGIILYEMLTGRHPFLDSSYEQTVRNILTNTPQFSFVENIKIPKALRELCLTCLEKNPKYRPSALDVVNALSGGKQVDIAIEQSNSIESHRLINKASSLIALGKLEEALLILEEYIEEHPYDYAANINLAELYYRSKDIEKSIQIAEKILYIAKWYDINMKSLVTLLTNTSSYYLSKDQEKSIMYSSEAIKIDPSDWQAWGNLAEGYRVMGSSIRNKEALKKGMEACLKGMELNPNNLKLKQTYGWLLYELEDYSTLYPYAIKLINTYSGDNVNIRFLVIKTLIAVGRLEEAEAFLSPMREYRELIPLIESADKDLARKRKEIHSNLS